MLNARKMFEKLGYDYYEIGFERKETHFICDGRHIVFYNDEKEFWVSCTRKKHLLTADYEAITLYMKEEGWI
ncbi:MAG: hypothetical protein M0Q88_00090 [Bacilli bacterium]|nr:hypothetical protein [Bacilli bacterium]